MNTEHVLLEGYCGTVRWRLAFDLYDWSLPCNIAIRGECPSYIFNFSFLCFSVSAARAFGLRVRQLQAEVPTKGGNQ